MTKQTRHDLHELAHRGLWVMLGDLVPFLAHVDHPGRLVLFRGRRHLALLLSDRFLPLSPVFSVPLRFVCNVLLFLEQSSRVVLFRFICVQVSPFLYVCVYVSGVIFIFGDIR